MEPASLVVRSLPSPAELIRRIVAIVIFSEERPTLAMPSKGFWSISELDRPFVSGETEGKRRGREISVGFA